MLRPVCPIFHVYFATSLAAFLLFLNSAFYLRLLMIGKRNCSKTASEYFLNNVVFWRNISCGVG